jgi:hypothetical protein
MAYHIHPVLRFLDGAREQAGLLPTESTVGYQQRQALELSGVPRPLPLTILIIEGVQYLPASTA